MVLLHQAWAAGIMADECMAEMVQRNIGLCKEMAKQIHKQDDFEDAVGYCIQGLVTAIHKWDSSRGLRFSTYAMKWIIQKFRRYQTTQSKTIRVSEHTIYKWLKIRRVYAEYINQHGTPPTDEQLSGLTGLSVAMIGIARDSTRIEPVSMNALIAGTDGLSFEDVKLVGDSTSPEEEHMVDTAANRLGGALLSLDEDSRYLLVRRFGLDGSKPETIQAIASRYRTPVTVIEAQLVAIFAELRGRYEVEDLT
jgi:RNA polymerase primary sigma factor